MNHIFFFQRKINCKTKIKGTLCICRGSKKYFIHKCAIFIWSSHMYVRSTYLNFMSNGYESYIIYYTISILATKKKPLLVSNSPKCRHLIRVHLAIYLVLIHTTHLKTEFFFSHDLTNLPFLLFGSAASIIDKLSSSKVISGHISCLSVVIDVY